MCYETSLILYITLLFVCTKNTRCQYFDKEIYIHIALLTLFKVSEYYMVKLWVVFIIIYNSNGFTVIEVI